MSFYRKPIIELRSVTCRMGSHSVTCHPTQVNTPRQAAGQYSIYRPRMDGRLSWLRQLVTYQNALPGRRQSPIQVLTWPGVEQLCWSDSQRVTATSRWWRRRFYGTHSPVIFSWGSAEPKGFTSICQGFCAIPRLVSEKIKITWRTKLRQTKPQTYYVLNA